MGEKEHAVDKCALNEVIAPVPTATAVEHECMSSPYQDLAKGDEEELVDYYTRWSEAYQE